MVPPMEFEANPFSVASDSCVFKKGSAAAFYAHISFVPHFFFRLKKKPACTTALVPLDVSVSGKNVFK